MRKTWKQFLAALLCVLTLILCMVPVQAEEDDDQTIMIHSRFYTLTTKKNHTMEVPFNPQWFCQDARIYSHDLAKLSLGLATSAFRPNSSVEQGFTSTDMNLTNFLTEAHFRDLRSDDYDKDPNMYTVSTVMGHQKITDGDESFELIAVGVCGQGYVDEWESNFSIGNGKMHDGFDRSSRLIYDRIFGYIAANHLTGPMKVWISGFSRAAAISNITAARLTDSDTFSQETVFAYTYATPRTVIDEDYDRYRNIYNIVGKQDPVPMVPYADWGYERYGTTLFLPALETDSDFKIKRARADAVYKEITGIDYWYNEETDWMIRDILSYLLTLCPSSALYTAALQYQLIHIWEDRNPVNILSRLLEIANDSIFINETTQEDADMLLNYLTLIARDFVDSGSIFRRWNRSASIGANMLQAHTPELYVSWIFSADSGDLLYQNATKYTILFVDTPADLTLMRDGIELEKIKAFEYLDVEDQMVEILPKKERVAPEGNVYMDYTESDIRIFFPRDAEYSLRVDRTDKDTMMSFMETDYSAGRQSPDAATLYYIPIEEPQDINITFTADGNTHITSTSAKAMEGLDSTPITTKTTFITQLSRPKYFVTNWRRTVLYFIAGVMGFISLLFLWIAYSIGKLRFKRRVRLGWIPAGTKYRALPFICAFSIMLLFVIMQFYAELFPDSGKVLLIFKSAIGLLSVLMSFFGWLKRRTKLGGFVILGLLALMLADLTMTLSLYGSLLHIAAYILLTWAYVKEEKPEKRQIVNWIVLCVAGIGSMTVIEGEFGVLRIVGILYLWAALAMVTSSFNQDRRIFTGSLLLFISGILLMNNIINGTTFLSHMLSLGVYYAAVATLASYNTRVIMPRLVPAEPSYASDDGAEAAAQPDDPAETAAES